MDVDSEALISKIKTLSESIWDRRPSRPQIDEWLANFTDDTVGDPESQRKHALFLLSNFLYFGARQMRELIKATYRDLFRYPIIESIRRRHDDTLDFGLIRSEFEKELRRTRFLGMGNPSESGCHLLYYFRQENGLPRSLFIHAHEIFTEGTDSPRSLAHPEIRRYVFIDDFCGKGSQAIYYSQQIVSAVKDLDPDIDVAYYMLFATRDGLSVVRQQTLFDSVEAVFELDPSFRCFDDEARYFVDTPSGITREFARSMCEAYGLHLLPDSPLGYGNCQLLIGFNHNVPDNTLPIFWSDGIEGHRWTPVFRRYPKLYTWK